MTQALSSSEMTSVAVRPYNLSARLINALAKGFCYASAVLTIGCLAIIFCYILHRGLQAFHIDLSYIIPNVPDFFNKWRREGLDFTPLIPDFTGFKHELALSNLDFFRELPGPPDTHFGMRNCIAGTFTLIVMASCLGIPVGMLCGIYLAEYAKDNWLAHTVRMVVDVLAGVPSIVVGVLGYSVFVVHWPTLDYYGGANPVNILVWLFNQLSWVRGHCFPTDYSAWAGALALGFMMCPIIARTTEEMLRLVPQAYREASVGVGASKFQTLFRVVIPAARAGIITGIMLSIARVAGETAPLLFTVCGSDQAVFNFTRSFPWITLDVNHAFPSLTVQIFKYANSPADAWKKQAWAGMLVLIVIVFVLNLAVRYVARNKHTRP